MHVFCCCYFFVISRNDFDTTDRKLSTSIKLFMHALRDIELLNYILSPSYIKGNKLSKVGHNVSSGLWIEIGVLQGSVKYETAMRKNCHSHFFFLQP